MTKAKFIAAYRERIVATYAWATNTGQLNDLMASVDVTLRSDRTTWVWDGPMSKAVWKALGGKGKMTLKALRALPAEGGQIG